MLMLGEIHMKQDKYTQAEPLLTDAHKGFVKRQDASPTPYDGQQIRKAVSHLVQLYEEQSQPDKAATWKEKLDALTDETTKDDGDN